MGRRFGFAGGATGVSVIAARRAEAILPSSAIVPAPPESSVTHQGFPAIAAPVQEVREFSIAAGKAVDLWLHDIGSGLNYTRQSFGELLRMVERNEVAEILTAHKDRLVRFGFERKPRSATPVG
ncbi:MAG: hypothetical protein HYV63_16845 [Candidatus Schekmanbacteria bacterium]|nr:hypothetical protein [Candidatus Schekmanbacteria bacterium]